MKVFAPFAFGILYHNASDKAGDSTKHYAKRILFIAMSTVPLTLDKHADNASCTTAEYNNWCAL